MWQTISKKPLQRQKAALTRIMILPLTKKVNVGGWAMVIA